jgi:hypothetical protein
MILNSHDSIFIMVVTKKNNKPSKAVRDRNRHIRRRQQLRRQQQTQQQPQVQQQQQPPQPPPPLQPQQAQQIVDALRQQQPNPSPIAPRNTEDLLVYMDDRYWTVQSSQKVTPDFVLCNVTHDLHCLYPVFYLFKCFTHNFMT